MRGTVSAANPWDVMVDMFFYREPGACSFAALAYVLSLRVGRWRLQVRGAWPVLPACSHPPVAVGCRDAAPQPSHILSLTRAPPRLRCRTETDVPLPLHIPSHIVFPAEEAKEEGEAEAAPEYDAAAGFAAAPLPGGEEASFDAYG